MQPQRSEKRLKQDVLDKQFSFSFTRGELLVVRAHLLKNQYSLYDAKVLTDFLDKVDNTVVHNITNDDYEAPDEKKEVVIS